MMDALVGDKQVVGSLKAGQGVGTETTGKARSTPPGKLKKGSNPVSQKL